MKVIDLLNKKANGEKLPKKIKIYDAIFTLIEYTNEMDYLYTDEDGDRLFYEFDWKLNDEIEIIEEEKDIEKINVWYEFDGKNNDEIVYIMCTELKNKINELIDIVKELKNESKRDV